MCALVLAREVKAMKKQEDEISKDTTALPKRRKPSEPKEIKALRTEIKRKIEKMDYFVRGSIRNQHQLSILADSLRRLNQDPRWIEILVGNNLTDYPRLKGEGLNDIFPVIVSK